MCVCYVCSICVFTSRCSYLGADVCVLCVPPFSKDQVGHATHGNVGEVLLVTLNRLVCFLLKKSSICLLFSKVRGL